MRGWCKVITASETHDCLVAVQKDPEDGYVVVFSFMLEGMQPTLAVITGFEDDLEKAKQYYKDTKVRECRDLIENYERLRVASNEAGV